jgi:DMSO/TMAO reductase YedYZ molybdopterin-dependent catalytic subunit
MRRRDLLALGLALPATRALAAAHPMIERSARPINEEALASTFTERITPIDSFFVRNHFDMPFVEASSYTLSLEGLVDAPVKLTLADLAKLPQVSVEAVLQCAGNGRALFRPRAPGVQWRRGAAGNAKWTGPRVKDVIALAKPKSQAAFVELQGRERPVLLTTPSFIRAIPIAKALHEDTIIALAMNDQVLPAVHGFPARLVAPGWVGDDWVKWLARLSLTSTEPQGFFYDTAYRIDGAPMTELPVKSILGAPADGAVIAPGKITVRGVAFSSTSIAKVDVSSDGGATWTEAKLVDKGGKYGFTVFEHVVDASPGALKVRARATDDKGNVQPSEMKPNPGGYLYNAIDGVDVEVRA